MAVELFGGPVPRGSRAAWAGEPQALSPVAATTCRVSMAAWKARRGSEKVRLNETFPAKFQHLYTTLTWRFLGWGGARDTLTVVSLCRDQGELTDNRPPRPAVSHGVSWWWTLASLAPEFGAAVPARRDGAGGVLDVQVP